MEYTATVYSSTADEDVGVDDSTPLPPIDPFDSFLWMPMEINPHWQQQLTCFLGPPKLSRVLMPEIPRLPLQTTPLTDKERLHLVRYSPFVRNSFIFPEDRLRMAMSKIPRTVTVDRTKMNPREHFEAAGDALVLIEPLYQVIRVRGPQKCEFWFRNFSRSTLKLKLLIDTRHNFKIKPKLKVLNPLESGRFELWYEEKRPQQRRLEKFHVFWSHTDFGEGKARLEAAKLKHEDFVDGFLQIPVIMENCIADNKT